MDQSGQIYFEREEFIPEADRERLLKAEREEALAAQERIKDMQATLARLEAEGV